MNRRSSAALALAGIAHATFAQPTLNINADQTSVSVGESVTWTVSLRGIINPSLKFLQIYDLNFNASSDIGAASAFDTNLSLLIDPTPGTPTGASIHGAYGGQSPLLDPSNTSFGNNVVLGTFSVTANAQGTVTYDIEDGGVQDWDIIVIRDGGSDFGPIAFEGRPRVASDTVIFTPTPGSAAVLFTGMAIGFRRRR